MGYQYTDYKANAPGYEVVTGKFCYPKPYGLGGTIAADAAKPRPLLVGTDVTIVASGADFQLTFAATKAAWAINVGDIVHFEGGECDGVYSVKTVTSGTVIKVYGPGQSITTGYVWFESKPQEIVGTGTLFKSWVKPGDFVVLISDALTPTVQVAKIESVETDLLLHVSRGFVTAVAAKAFLFTRGGLVGVAIKCGGAGTVMGQSVASGDIPSFLNEAGLDPIYGDAGGSTFKILTQK